jgi:hypothetical protein
VDDALLMSVGWDILRTGVRTAEEVLVLEVCVAVRGDDGVLVDPGALGVERLIALIRAIPPGAPAKEYAVYGASVDVLESIEVVVGQVAALRAAAVHAVAEDIPAGVVADQVVDMLMMALNRSRPSGQILSEQSLSLTHQPQVWAALWAGQVDVTKAGIVAAALYMVPRLDARDQQRPDYDEDCQRLLAAGLAYAADHTARQLDRHLKRLLAEIDPSTVVTRRRRALAERGVWIGHRGDGTADLTARLDSTDAERVYAAIRATALAAQRTDSSTDTDSRCPDGAGGSGARAGAGTGAGAGAGAGAGTGAGTGSGAGSGAGTGTGTGSGAGSGAHAARATARSLDLLMADALVDLIVAPRSTATPTPDHNEANDAASATGHPAGHVCDGAGRPRSTGGVVVTTQINVTIPIDSLAGLCDTPGQLSGYGILPAEEVRRLAAGDTRWRHILTDRATGAVLDVGTWSYRPPAALSRHVRTRDVTCRFPGCTVPAGECDLDHLVPFPEGPTSAQNLHALCRRHHRLKHDDNWTVEPLPNSGLRWTSPLGTTRNTWPDTDHARERLTHAA